MRQRASIAVQLSSNAVTPLMMGSPIPECYDATVGPVPSQHDASRVKARPTPVWKRCLDWGVILVASPVVLVVGAILAVVIKAVSKGPILFR